MTNKIEKYNSNNPDHLDPSKYEVVEWETVHSGRYPSSVKIVMDYKQDAQRRDFTINAMAVDKDGNVIDHFDGHGDIKNKVLRTVGDPNKRFQEDYLRMLRAVRFASRMGFKIDPETMDAIKSNSSNIKGQAVERIVKELMKMAGNGKQFANAIIILKETGLLQHILPEIVELDDLPQTEKHHPEGNVFKHSLQALRVADSSDPMVNLGILFHDVGKLDTQSSDETGWHYHGHEAAGMERINKIAKRLKLDNNTKNCLKYVSEHHMKVHDLWKMKGSKVMNIMDSPYWDVLYKVSEADTKSRLHAFNPVRWKRVTDFVDKMKDRFKDKNALDVIKTVVNGKHIMDVLGIGPGKRLGIIRKNVLDWVLDNNININNIKAIDDKIREVNSTIEESLKEQYDKLTRTI